MSNKEILHNSVVQIITTTLEYDWWNPYQSPKTADSVGSGVFINNKGHILTCSHCIESATEIKIIIPSSGKKKFKATVISFAPEYDLALLQIHGYKNNKFLKIGNSDNLEFGETVYAVGYPLGQTNLKISNGSISGLQDHLIQTDASINPGNSGGPLIDKNNNIIAINSQKIASAEADNIGYAVPIKYFQILEKEFCRKTTNINIIYKPSLLISLSKSNDLIKKYLFNDQKIKGSIIRKIEISSILKNSDIKEHDILMKINNYEIDEYAELKVEWSQQRINLKDYFYRLKKDDFITLTYYNKDNGIQICKNIQLNIPKYIIRKVFVNLTKNPINYEVFNGLVLSEFRLNHIEMIQMMRSNISEKNILKLHSYYLNEEKRFCNKILLTNILSGSNIKENLDLEPGLFLDKINDIVIDSLDTFRKVIIKLINDKPYDPIKLLFDNNSFIITNLEESCKQEQINNQKFNYKPTHFINILKSVLSKLKTGNIKLPIKNIDIISKLDQSFIINTPIEYNKTQSVNIQELNKDIEDYNKSIHKYNDNLLKK